ncbi:MAG: sigma-54-dependent Fis family transcriptional regulator [Deltaproteobacteria bacterium]|nr:sigma-54-dependent Fis family transcriptional regulator [Candidatus Anaeroferrophillus wilburensis]MBN2889272.1 sigma-54-dependent Fis family transcriptional regulator [Deltaproteobacteria bacterium]
MGEFLEIMLGKQGYQVSSTTSAGQAIALLDRETIDLVISDISMPEMNGLDLLKIIKEKSPATAVVMITAYASTDTAILAMKNGAYDYITKPFNNDEILLTIDKALQNSHLQRENRRLQQELEQRYGFGSLIGKSSAMLKVYDLIQRVAQTKANILVTGESGTGKELVARAIHYTGPRKDQPFVTVNCGAIPEQLLESEFFGHEKGAFTGAVKTKDGYFTAAHGGTIFLDEIGELPLALQVKLLRVIQEKSFKRVGSTVEQEVEVQIISATNRDLETAVAEGSFREDLYYRLNVIKIDLPPLRERAGDIPLLVRHFLEHFNREYGRTVTSLTPEATKVLIHYPYPGNVRELENIIERSVVLENTEELTAASLPTSLTRPTAASTTADIHLTEEGIDLEETVANLEKSLINQALELSGHHKTKAAELLGLSFRSLRYRLDKYQIE